jgi:hypothetical protein
MRIPESKIKRAILHPDENVRAAAVSYFSGSFSPDKTVMPLVIQTVQSFGRKKAFHVLRVARRLAQTPAAAEWLVGELRRHNDLSDQDDEDYRFTIARILYRAAPEILLRTGRSVAELPMFPHQLRRPLVERLDMLNWDWGRGWAALEALGRNTMPRGELAVDDLRYAHRIIESLARHRASKAEFVIDTLALLRQGRAGTLLRWLEVFVVAMAGMMRLDSAVPFLLERLRARDLGASEAAIAALIRLNNDSVVQAIAGEWPWADLPHRMAAPAVLEHTHTDLCAETCLGLFSVEENHGVRLALADALLSQLDEEAVEPVRRLVLGRDGEITPGCFDIRHRLVVVQSLNQAASLASHDAAAVRFLLA